jgi:hypothetical protein
MTSITAAFRDQSLLPRASALLWIASISAAFHHTASLYTATELLLVAALYLALSFAVVSLALLLRRGGLPGALGGSALISALLLWHLREQTDLVHFDARPASSLLFFALCFASTAFLLMRRKPSGPLAVDVRAAVISVVCLLVGSAAVIPGPRPADGIGDGGGAARGVQGGSRRGGDPSRRLAWLLHGLDGWGSGSAARAT